MRTRSNMSLVNRATTSVFGQPSDVESGYPTSRWETMTKLAKRTILVIVCTLLSVAQLQAQTSLYREDRILVKPSGNIDSLHTRLGTRILRSYPQIGNIQVIELPAGLTVARAIAEFERSGLVQYAEPDYLYHATVTYPNDPAFTNGTLWGLHNTGQNGGVNDADIDAPEGWDRRTNASSVIVAVTDTGVRYTHEDLAGNMWTNPGETAGNGIDDDGNGYVDGVHGINAITNSAPPIDDNHHGTHVAGTIGAVGNNSTGVVGVAWSVRIMALKFLNSSGSGSASDAIECIDYATKMRAHIINASWGGTGFSQALREAIARARNQGILFVAAAGNTLYGGSDNDSYPLYPAGYDLDNVIAVAASTRTDARASYSHWGLVSVHLAGPGGEVPNPYNTNYPTWTNGIYSTWNSSDSAYQYLAGTSMAAPHVSGALALLWAYEAVESYVQLKNRLLSSTDPLAGFSGRCQTGGRLNLNGALSTTFWRPRNNNFANSFTIARPSSVSSITFVANNVDATKEAGEPNHAGNAGGKSVWWNWQAPSTASATFATKGSGFDTLLAVYTGSSVSNLTLVTSDDEGGQCGTSQVTFTPASGTTYRIAVDGNDGAQGTIKLTLQTSSAAQPASLRFVLGTVDRTSGQFAVTINGPASATEVTEISSDLSVWTPYATNTLSGGGAYNYTDTNASSSIRFYRARIPSTSQESCNVVGYADLGVTAEVFRMIANPFNAVDNRVTALLPSPPEGTTIYKYDPGSGGYIEIAYVDGAWEGDDLDMTLAPGEGVFIYTGVNWTATFAGEVAQGHGVNPVDNGLTIRSSIVPQAGRVVTDLHLPVVNGDTVTRVINGTNATYTFSSGAWSPSEPSVSIGESFWNNKSIGFWWHRNFLIWP